LSRKQTILTERPPLVGEVSANFCGYRVPRGQRDIPTAELKYGQQIYITRDGTYKKNGDRHNAPIMSSSDIPTEQFESVRITGFWTSSVGSYSKKNWKTQHFRNWRT
jgi:hypothetical protein